MAQLRQDYARFQSLDCEIIVIGLEDAEAFARYWEEHEPPFIDLPDPDHHALRLYGQEVKLLRLGRMPAQVLVDKLGGMRFAHYGHSIATFPKTRTGWLCSMNSTTSHSLKGRSSSVSYSIFTPILLRK
ncbi:MAG: peroxiredoxin family protein [Chloroflexi bacterium]|nr:peroxiredoxin family protein [Chloroflexota bacterium]